MIQWASQGIDPFLVTWVSCSIPERGRFREGINFIPRFIATCETGTRITGIFMILNRYVFMSKELFPPSRITREDLITLGDLDAFRLLLLAEIKELLKSRAEPSPKQWLRSAEVRRLLGVSAGTLQNLRINGTLPFTRMGAPVFYRYEDILSVLEKNHSSHHRK